MKILTIVLIAILFGALGGIGATYAFMNFIEPEFNQEQLIAEYYAIETAASISPTELKIRMDKGETNFVVVDLRNEGAYNTGHVAGAINVPNADEASIISAFKKIIAENPNKEIITYCYSSHCMLSRRVGDILAKQGMFVKHLNVGGTEWVEAYSGTLLVETGEGERIVDSNYCDPESEIGC